LHLNSVDCGISSCSVTAKTNTESLNSKKSNIVIFNPIKKNEDNFKQAEPPKEIDKQLDIIFETSKKSMVFIPPVIKPFTKNVTKDFIQLLDNKDFRTEMNNLLTKERTKPGNANKDVIQLTKDEKVFNEVFNCIKTNAKKANYNDLYNVLGIKVFGKEIVRDTFAGYIKEGKHAFLLYGEKHK